MRGRESCNPKARPEYGLCNRYVLFRFFRFCHCRIGLNAHSGLLSSVIWFHTKIPVTCPSRSRLVAPRIQRKHRVIFDGIHLNTDFTDEIVQLLQRGKGFLFGGSAVMDGHIADLSNNMDGVQYGGVIDVALETGIRSHLECRHRHHRLAYD